MTDTKERIREMLAQLDESTAEVRAARDAVVAAGNVCPLCERTCPLCRYTISAGFVHRQQPQHPDSNVVVCSSERYSAPLAETLTTFFEHAEHTLPAELAQALADALTDWEEIAVTEEAPEHDAVGEACLKHGWGVAEYLALRLVRAGWACTPPKAPRA